VTESNGCGAYQGDYSALIDGELTPARAGLVQAHLAGCERCRSQVAALRSVDRALGALSPPALPADLRARLQSRIEPSVAAPVRRAPPARRRWLAAPLAAAAMAAAVAAVVYLVPVAPDEAPAEEQVVIAEPPVIEEQIVIEEPVVIARVEPAIPETPPEVSPPALAPRTRAPADLEEELGLESVEDLDVIANLELLEAFVALDGGTG
jgi:anti-sigma factor RsiW